MANGENLGASFSIDITNLKAGLSTANKLIRESESQYKAAAAGMDDWSDSQEGLEAQIKNLNTITDIQRKKVDALNKEYDRLIADGMDPASNQAIQLRTQINNETAALNKNEATLKKTKSALADVENGLNDTADAADDAADGFTVAKGAAAEFIGNGLTAIVGAAKNAISSLLGLADATREYRTELAKVENAAEVAGASADYITDKWQDVGSVLGDEGAVGEGMNNLLAAGFTTQESMDSITKHLEGAALKWKDTLKFEGMADGLQETLATGAAVGPFAELLERAGVNLKTFDAGLRKCTTDAEKQNYVLDQLSKLGLAEVSESYREQNKDLINANKAQADFTEKQAELGEKMQPVSTAIKSGFAGILDTILELTEGVDFEAFATEISGAFDYVTAELLPAVKTGIKWVMDNIPTLTVLISGITAAIAAQKVANLAATAAQNGMTLAQYAAAAAQKALNAAMKANPIGLVITLVTALVAAIVYLWQNSESFRNFWIGLWQKIQDATKVTVDAIKRFFTALWSGIVALWNGAPAFFSGLWSGIKNIFADVGDFFSQKFTDAYEAIKKVFSGIGKFFAGIWDTIKSTFSTIGTKVGDAIGGAFKSAINAVIGTVEGALNAIPNSVNAMIGKINELPGVQIGSIPTVSLPRLAKGGIVDRATAAIIGEDGKEAVMPLEKNTGWIKYLARQIAAEQKQGVTVQQYNTFSQAHSRYEMYKMKQQTAAAVKLALKEV